MKPFYVFSILSLLITLTSCGGGGTSGAKLEIVNSFAVAGNKFDGGLIITGKNSTGATFSIALGAGGTAELELPNGSWNFWAVGWSGDAAQPVLKFSNATFCAATSANLNGGDVTVPLRMTRANCISDDFAGSAYRDATDFKMLSEIVALKALTKPATLSDTPESKKISSADSTTSLQVNFPKDLQTRIRGVRFSALRKDIGSAQWSRGFSGPCITGSEGFFYASSGYGANPLRLPTRNTPVGVELFEGANCTDPLTFFEFPEGFEQKANGDYLLNNFAGSNRLVLAGTDIRKGYSATFAHMPYVKCWNGSSEQRCNTMPSTLPHYIFPLSSGLSFFLPNVTAPTVFTEVTGELVVGVCAPSGDGMNCALNTSGGNPDSLYFLDDGVSPLEVGLLDGTEQDRIKYSAFRELIGLLGPSNFSGYRPTFTDTHGGDEEDRIAYGKLGRVREHLSPGGAMGLFGVPSMTSTFAQNCRMISGTKEITLEDDGEKSTYRIVVSTPDPLAPPFAQPDPAFCQALIPTASNCGSVDFDKKIQIFDITENPNASPQMTYLLDCDQRYGKFEHAEVNEEENRRNTSRQIISWNSEVTGSLSNQRYEFIELNQEEEKSGGVFLPKSDLRSFGRVFKRAGEKVQSVVLSSRSFFDGALWKTEMEVGHSYLLSNTGLGCLTNFSRESEDSDKWFILTSAATPDTTFVTTSQIFPVAPTYELPVTTSWESTNVTAAASCETFATLPTGNDLINRSLLMDVNSLQTLPSQFGSFLTH